MLARPEGNPGASQFLGSYADVLRNWLRLIAAAGLSRREFIEAQCLFAASAFSARQAHEDGKSSNDWRRWEPHILEITRAYDGHARGELKHAHTRI